MKYLCSIIFIVLTHSTIAQQQLQVPGLKDKVEVIRDKWGVNHIYAQNEYDLFFTQGYCAAKDRLFQFEVWRRQATGTMAELMGESALKRDVGARLFSYRGDMEKELAHYHPKGKTIINAYVDGINAYIKEVNKNPKQLPFEFQLLNTKPGYWTPAIVVSRHQGIRSNVTQELNMARAIAKVGEEKVRDLVWFHPNQPDLKIDASINTDLLFEDILAPYEAVNKDLTFNQKDFETEQMPEGSNNWIISGSRTASGLPIMANDPHRKISTPSLRYIVHLVAPGWDVIGGGEPVIPGVSIGHNQYGAWGLTIFETDAEDLYVYDINPANPSQYQFNGEWKNMSSATETFKRKNKKDTSVTLYFTHHGPVTKIDTKNNKAYAIRCAWLEPGGAPYMASLRIDQAKNWEEFRDACAYSHIPGENMIWADKKGNIGWQAVGITPIRNTHSGMVPIPGNGKYEWKGFLPIKERPYVFNPAKGFFATANQHVTPSDYKHPSTLAYTWADDYRGDRVNEVLSATSKSTIESSMALQTDYTSLPARELVPLLMPLQFSNNLVDKAKSMLKDWNFELDKSSIPAAIYVIWERTIIAQARNQFVPKEISAFITVQTSTIIDWMKHPEKMFGENGNTKRDVFLQQCFEKAIEQLKNKLGEDMQHWQYGQAKYKHISIKHPLSDWVDDNMKNKIDFGPLPRSGYGLTPGANGTADNQTAGASFRIVVDLADWDKAVMTNTPGQSGNPDSPFYRNLFENWANDQYFPALYSKEKILNNAAEKFQLNPRIKK
jgi:penicillin amidase